MIKNDLESTPENVMKYLNELDSFEVEQKAVNE